MNNWVIDQKYKQRQQALKALALAKELEAKKRLNRSQALIKQIINKK